MSLLDLVNQSPHFRDKRKISLYSNFRRLKEVNPDGYQANLTAWKSVLLNAIDSGIFLKQTNASFIIQADSDLTDALYDPEYGRPLALDCVFDELVQDHVLVPLSVFKTSRRSIYSGDSIVSWLLSKVIDTTWKSAVPDSMGRELKPEKYIYLKNLDVVASKVWTNLQSSQYSQAIYTKEMIYDFLKPILPSKDLVDLVLTYLSRDKPHLSIRGDIVKATSVRSDITERDEAIASLCSTIYKLSDKVHSLSERLEQDTAKSKLYAKRGNKSLAKYYLKSKLLTEKTQESCLAKLENVETVLSKIDSAMADELVVKAIADGTALMKSIQHDIGGLDKVEHLVEEFRDHAITSDEISAKLYDMSMVEELDDDELARELQELQAEEADKNMNNNKDSAKSRLDNIPKLPSTAVGSRPGTSSPTKKDAEESEMTDQLGDLSLEEVKAVKESITDDTNPHPQTSENNEQQDRKLKVYA